MKEQNLYRCSFVSQKAWKDLESELIGNGETPLYNFTVKEVGHVPYYTEEEIDGEIVKTEHLNDDWAVDIYTYEFIDELKQYLVVDEPKQWRNEVQGGVFNIIKP